MKMMNEKDILRMKELAVKFFGNFPKELLKDLPFNQRVAIHNIMDLIEDNDRLHKKAEVIVQTCIDNNLIIPQGKDIVVTIVLRHARDLSVHSVLSAESMLDRIYADVSYDIGRLRRCTLNKIEYESFYPPRSGRNPQRL